MCTSAKRILKCWWVAAWNITTGPVASEFGKNSNGASWTRPISPLKIMFCSLCCTLGMVESAVFSESAFMLEVSALIIWSSYMQVLTALSVASSSVKLETHHWFPVPAVSNALRLRMNKYAFFIIFTLLSHKSFTCYVHFHFLIIYFFLWDMLYFISIKYDRGLPKCLSPP